VALKILCWPQSSLLAAKNSSSSGKSVCCYETRNSVAKDAQTVVSY
jgi:hypothetical protein